MLQPTWRPPMPFIVCRQSSSKINSLSQISSASSVLINTPLYWQTGAPAGIVSHDLTPHPLLAVRKTCSISLRNLYKQANWICYQTDATQTPTSRRYCMPFCVTRLEHLWLHPQFGPHSYTTSMGSTSLQYKSTVHYVYKVSYLKIVNSQLMKMQHYSWQCSQSYLPPFCAT